MRNTEIVPLNVARDMNKLKVPADAEVYDKWYEFYSGVEDHLFAATCEYGFTPEQVNNVNVTDMVRQQAMALTGSY